MLAAEYNAKYNKLLGYFGQLRLFRTNNVRWGMKGDTHYNDSLRLFLYLRTLNRYSPGINLSDLELNIIFKNALTLVSGLSFLKIEGIIDRVQPINTCGCKCGQTVVNIITNITGTTYNEDKIEFSTSNPTGYTLEYAAQNLSAFYGNNPDVSLFQSDGNVFPEDMQTPPLFIYTQAGDPTTSLIRITWDFPIPSAGYIRISGRPLNFTNEEGGGDSGGSGGTVSANIIEDDTSVTYTLAQLNEFYPIGLNGIGTVVYCGNIGIQYLRLTSTSWSSSPLTLVD